jgi:hypothetical protein
VGHGGGSDSALLLAAATFGRTAVEHLDKFEFTVKAAVAFIYAPSRFFLKTIPELRNPLPVSI